jgi:hypothetical protein
MGVAADNAHGPAEKKFLRRFFQKAATFFPPSPPSHSRPALGVMRGLD